MEDIREIMEEFQELLQKGQKLLRKAQNMAGQNMGERNGRSMMGNRFGGPGPMGHGGPMGYQMGGQGYGPGYEQMGFRDNGGSGFMGERGGY